MRLHLVPRLLLAGVFAGQGVTVGAFLHFLVWATLGNAIGGPFFVAIIKYNHAIGATKTS